MKEILQDHFQKEIGILDGAMGSLIQKMNLTGDQVLGDVFRGRLNLLNLPDAISLSNPSIIQGIHEGYLKAGSRILRTNTFGANTISTGELGLSESELRNINTAGVNCAKRARDNYGDSKVLIAGSLGPTNKQLSISIDNKHPEHREINFEDLVISYYKQINWLMEGGVDLLFTETAIDTLNLKACLIAVDEYCRSHKKDIPIMASVSVDQSFRTMISGQNIEALWTSIEHMKDRLLSIGINCALGPKELIKPLSQLNDVPILVSCHPNAGLPNEFGGYDLSEDEFSRHVVDMANNGLVNIAGGCCGTNESYIRQLSEKLRGIKPRKIPNSKEYFCVSGTDRFLSKGNEFIKVGERANVMGSIKFKKLIKEGKFKEALEIVREQIKLGANIIDINMDADLIDGKKAIINFIRLIGSEPDLAKIPLMIDSSDFEVLEAGLQNTQGKCIVNSLSLKDGEFEFKEKAKIIKKYGAAILVIASSEKGQAVTVEEKYEACELAFDILVNEIGYNPRDIIFDPNVLTIGTGDPNHADYANYFFEGIKRIKKGCPGALVSGGISNISFSFKGNENLRIAINTVFLYHAISAGLDMGIVNVSQYGKYDEIDPELRNLIEDLIFNRTSNATDNLIEYSKKNDIGLCKEIKGPVEEQLEWRSFNVQERLIYGLKNGISTFLIDDLNEIMTVINNPYDIIGGPLLQGMQIVGDLFQKGEMFLAQVLKSAKVMSEATSYLEQFFKKDDVISGINRTIVLATLKGDQHDIGKNIVKIVLECNGFKVIDLGINVEGEKIIKTALEVKAGIIGVSGLIVPTLHEIEKLARRIEEEGLNIPLLVGGATTSQMHTAVRLSGVNSQVFHAKDAAEAAVIAQKLFNDDCGNYKEMYREQLLRLSHQYEHQKGDLVSYEQALKMRIKVSFEEIKKPNFVGKKEFVGFPIKDLFEYIDWTPFFASLKFKGKYPDILNDPTYGNEASKVFNDAQKLLNQLINEKAISVNGVYSFWRANSSGDDVIIFDDKGNELERFHMLRRQQNTKGNNTLLSLSDFVAPVETGVDDYIGGFAVGVIGADEVSRGYEKKGDLYNSVLVKLLADRLAESFSEFLHQRSRIDLGLTKEGKLGIRPAFGYPSLPDISEIKIAHELLEVGKLGFGLTESFQMQPNASCCGLYFWHPEAKYFNIGRIGKDQVEDYSVRKGIGTNQIEIFISKNLSC